MRSRLEGDGGVPPVPWTARVLTGPLGFFLAGTLDVGAAWGRWAFGELAARLARRPGR